MGYQSKALCAGTVDFRSSISTMVCARGMIGEEGVGGDKSGQESWTLLIGNAT
jgi:hypothetical protein